MNIEEIKDWRKTHPKRINPEYMEIIDTLLAIVEQHRFWIPVTEKMPEPGVPVIALVNPNEWGKKYRIRAQWAPAKTLELDFDAEGGQYDEETDKYYCDEGWYETNEFEDVHWNVHGTITHWQPLPPYPDDAPA